MPNKDTRSKIALIFAIGLCVYLFTDMILSYYLISNKTVEDERLLSALAMAIIAIISMVIGGKNDNDNDPKTT